MKDPLGVSPSKGYQGTTVCCRLKKVVAESRARFYFEQQILALLLVFHQIHNLSWIHIKQINQSARCISSTGDNFFSCATLRDKLIAQGESTKHRPKTCGKLFYLVFRRHRRANIVSRNIDYFTDRLMFSLLLLLLSSLYVNVVTVYVLCVSVCGSYLRCNYLIYTIWNPLPGAFISHTSP